MTINPFAIVLALCCVAVISLLVIGTLLALRYREGHPSFGTRQKALDRAVMMDEMTDEEYADKKIALDRERERATLNRRMK